MCKTNNDVDGKRRVYIRPEDILELVVNNIRSDKWTNVDMIEENISKMLLYFKEEKFDRLKTEFDL